MEDFLSGRLAIRQKEVYALAPDRAAASDLGRSSVAYAALQSRPIRGCGGGERPECARGYAPIRFTISPSASRQVIGFQAGSKIR